MAAITEHQQGLNLGRRYEFFEIDLTAFNLGYVRVFEGDEGAVDHVVTFGGTQYNPWPIKTGGWGVGSQGRLPRPLFALGNANGFFTAMADNNNGLKGAPVRRMVTYERYLDGQPDADPNEHDPIDYYEINRRTALGKIEGVEIIQWELRTPPDKPNAKAPRIQIIKGPCQFSYRVWDGAQFVNGSCPYRGAATFDEDGNVVGNADDACAQTVPACVDRHGPGNKIPYMGFPSVGDLRR